MKKVHEIQSIRFASEKMILQVDGRECVFQIADISTKLAEASSLERSKYELSPSGYGIHWPLIDEDLSVDGLLKMQATLRKTGAGVSS